MGTALTVLIWMACIVLGIPIVVFLFKVFLTTLLIILIAIYEYIAYKF